MENNGKVINSYPQTTLPKKIFSLEENPQTSQVIILKYEPLRLGRGKNIPNTRRNYKENPSYFQTETNPKYEVDMSVKIGQILYVQSL